MEDKGVGTEDNSYNESFENKHFILDSDEEQVYEKTPRRNKEWMTQKLMKLPIKLPDGRIKQQKQNPSIDESCSSSESDEDESKEIRNDDENDSDQQNPSDDLYIIQKKEELAEIAQRITADPENNV